MTDDLSLINKTNRITERLMNIRRRRRRMRLRYSLLTLFIVMCVTPAMVWVAWLVAPDVVSGVTSGLLGIWNISSNTEDPLAFVALPPAALVGVVLGVVAFVITRSLESPHAEYLGFTLVMGATCLIVVGALLMAVDSCGLTVCSLATGKDYFVVVGMPLGLFVAIGASLGWRLSELG